MANNKTSKLLVGLIIGFMSLVAPATAAQGEAGGRMVEAGALTSIPIGHLQFCESRPAECAANAQVVAAIELNEQRWGQLLEVNATLNQRIVPITDQDLYQVAEFWTFPNGYGDCEDIALAKRRELIEAGWPTSTLLMAVVREANGEGHAVLMVRTDRGDLVLDNKDGRVNLWNDTPYQFIKRQSQANAGQWVDLVDERPMIMADSR